MPVMHHLPFNYNNLVINLVVPGFHNSEDLSESVWLKDSYQEIENEYESLGNKNDCLIYIFSIRPEDWVKEKGLIKIARKLGADGKFDDIKGFENFDFYTSENIAALFDEVIRIEKGKYLTNKVLVTYGHSSGYYFFGDKNFDEQILDIDSEYPLKKTLFGPLKVWFNGLFLKESLDKSKNQTRSNYNETPCISAITLAKGISISAINKFDTIILGSCNMQNIDVLSTLKNSCNYIIASQTFLPVKAYRFDTFISNLQKINFEFCKTIINESDAEMIPGQTGISVVNTKYLDPLIRSLVNINRYLISNYASLKNKIIKSREEITYINGGREIYSVDLFQFYKRLFINIADIPTPIKKEFQYVFNELLDKTVYMSQLYNTSSLTGICIYFPKTKYTYQHGARINNIIYGLSPITNSYFSINSNWGEFLSILYQT